MASKKSVKLYKTWQLAQWDEFQLVESVHSRRLSESIRAAREYGTKVDFGPTRPSIFEFCVKVVGSEIHVSLLEANSRDQYLLGCLAQKMRQRDLRVTNPRDSFSPSLPFRLAKLFGWQAFLTKRCWFMRKYEPALVLRREDQQFKDGFDVLIAKLVENDREIYTHKDFSWLSHTSISSTLGREESNKFWMARR